MTNVAVFNPAAVPAFVKARGELSAVAKALAGGAGGGGKRISIKGGVFRLVAGGKEVAAIEERYLDVVVVNSAPKVSRVFYMAKYEADKVVAPECWSQDGDKPASEVETPQATTCAECPQNIAGSGNGNSRACRYQQRLAVVLANDMEGDVLQLTLPATSIFGKEEGDNRPLQAYARWLVAQNIDPTEVVTRMRFDTKSESPKLFFKTMRYLTDDEYPTCTEKGASVEAKQAVTMTVAKMDKVAEVSAPIEGKRPTKAAPAPQAEEEDEAPAPAPKAKAKTTKAAAPTADADDEPVVRKEDKKPSAVPTQKANLADMVDDWDAE
jgi:hypothetical protein